MNGPEVRYEPTRNPFEALEAYPLNGPRPHVRVVLAGGQVITGRVVAIMRDLHDEVIQARDPVTVRRVRRELTVEDYRGDLHEIDGELVVRFHLFDGREPVLDWRAQRALEALSSPFSRPFVYLRPGGRWAVAHQRAPVALAYDSQADAMRAAAGCVA